MILSKKYSVFLFLFSYIFLFLFFNSQLSPLYEFNSWTDVNIYFTIGKGLMNDLVVYRDLFDHKGPLIFFIYGFGYLISNTSFFGVFLIEVCLFSIGIYYIYLIIKMFSSDILSLSLSTLFPIFYLFFSYKGGSAEDFVLIAEIVSLYYFIKYFNSEVIEHSRKYMFIHGLLVACVFFIKLNLIIYWFFPLLFIFILLIFNKLYLSVLQNIFFLLLGILSVSLPILLYFIINNSLFYFWDAYIDFNLLYSSQSERDLFERILFNISELKFRDVFFINFCLFGFITFYLSRLVYKQLGILILFCSFIIQLIVTYSGAYVMTYYLISSIVFAVLGFIAFAVYLKSFSFFNNLKLFPYIFACFCFFLGTIRTNLYGYSIENLITRNFPDNQITFFGEEILTKDEPSLLCVGFDETLTIFTLYDIIPNVRYFFLPNITLEQYPDICNAQIGYILNKEVDFLILDDRFRYYDYYIDAINTTYKIKSTCVGNLGYNIHLYEKK